MPVKAGRDLAQYLEARKTDEPLFGDIQKHVLRKAGLPSGRRQDVMHPSEMIKTDWCHRSAYYRLKTNSSVKQSTSFQRENIFEEGHCTHKKWQSWLVEMGRLSGDWHCLNCDQVFWDDHTPQQCLVCNAPPRCLEYAEVPLNAHPLMIGGKSDGYCPQDNCLIEIKTMGLGSIRYEMPSYLARYEEEVNDSVRTVVDLDRLWRDFRRPLPNAVKQAQLYMYLANEFEDLPCDRTVFLYDFKANQASKSFMVPFDPKFSEPVIDAAEAIVDCLATDTPPFCNIAGRQYCSACATFEEPK